MRFDATELKENLTLEDVKKLLHELGANELIDEVSKGRIITNTVCHNDHSGSLKLYYYIESHSFYCYTGCSCSFDIYELVRRVYQLRGIEMHFGSLVNWVAEKLGKAFGFGFNVESEIVRNTDLDWMRKVSKKKIQHPALIEHSDRVLDVFDSHMSHPEFTNDNISPEAMDRFDIKYNAREDALVIPHRHWNTGKIVGLMNRSLNPVSVERGFKYVPTTVQGQMYNHSKHLNLYGLYHNIEIIKRLKKCVIFESEKSVMQCESYWAGNNFSLALSGRNISQYQVDTLLSLGIDEIILATDKQFKEPETKQEQLDIEYITRIGRRFAPYVRVYTLFDRYGLLDFKDSPSDCGVDVLKTLMAAKEEIFNKE